MWKTFVQALMSAGADAICGAPFGAMSEDRFILRRYAQDQGVHRSGSNPDIDWHVQDYTAAAGYPPLEPLA